MIVVLWPNKPDARFVEQDYEAQRGPARNGRKHSRPAALCAVFADEATGFT